MTARSILASALLLVSVIASFAANAGESSAAKIPAYEARPGHSRAVIAVVGENSGTELTDFVIPYGILSRSGAAEVLTVATQSGPMQLRPALRIQPDLTVASFDERFPDGADYVIVPAVMTMDAKAPPVLTDWIKAQADKGASIVSICDGALIAAKAGVFKGHRATGHWATLALRRRVYPDTQWLENTRYVADGKAISSAGVTAAIPLSLALVEAIAGTARAVEVAHEIGLTEWNSEHDSERFHRGFGVYSLAIRNGLRRRQEIGLPVTAGVDEVALALTADAFSRTYRSLAYAVADAPDPVRTEHGLTLLPDRIAGQDRMPQHLRPAFDAMPSARALDNALADIAGMYGRSTARFVALQLEYAQSP